MTDVEIIMVCTGNSADAGSPVGVVMNGSSTSRGLRTEIVEKLPVSEVAFVDDTTTGTLSILDASGELTLAAQPVMATVWMLRRLGIDLRQVTLPFGPLPVGADDGSAWVGIPVTAAPPIPRVRLSSPSELNALTPTSAEAGSYYWVGEDREFDAITARRFDESGNEEHISLAPAIGLVAELGRAVTISQQNGAELRARPTAEGFVVLSGDIRHRTSMRVAPR